MARLAKFLLQFVARNYSYDFSNFDYSFRVIYFINTYTSMVNITTRHPFIDGLDQLPENREKDLQKIKNWMASQPHLPEISDEYIYLFLHACYYVHDKTKQTIETYFTLRTSTPCVFGDRDALSPRMMTIMHMANLVRLPKSTPEGYKVLLYSVKDSDYTKLVFSDAVKAFCMYNDCVLSEDGLAEGYVVIFDMKGVSLGHLARVSLPALRAFMVYIQEAHPARLKGIHVLNTPNFINHVMRIVVPMVKSELLSLIKFHKGIIPEGLPIELMPSEYGGEAPSIETLDKDTKDLTDKYVQWLKDSEAIKVDESKRPKKQSWWSIFSSPTAVATANMSIEQQKENFFKNLQID